MFVAADSEQRPLMTDAEPDPAEAPAPTAQRRIIRPWMARVLLSGMLATGAAVLAMRTPWSSMGLSAPPELIAIGAGWLMLMCTLPWKRMRMLSHVQSDLALFTQKVRCLKPSDRRMSIRILPTDRDDELGDVARAVHDVLTEAIARRIEVKTIQRTMDESIRRETQRATAHLQREATTDPLTGLGNRRCLEQFWDRLIDPAGRAIRSGSIVAIDLNDFKPINDTLGHDVGDEVLQFLGRIIASSLRQQDIAVRLGGDEFLVVLPDHPEHDALTAVKRLEALFRQMPWPHKKLNRPSFSFGVASFRRGDIISEEVVFKAADSAMYRQKQERRRRRGTAAA